MLADSLERFANAITYTGMAALAGLILAFEERLQRAGLGQRADAAQKAVAVATALGRLVCRSISRAARGGVKLALLTRSMAGRCRTCSMPCGANSRMSFR
ncbi:MAG: hypothetical protein R3E68_19250 [Burkholderiaceae bacterium]